MTTCVEIENDIIKNNLTTSDWISNEYFYDTFEYVKNSGLWLEFGVATGRTINIISSKTTNKVYGFDTFQGLPEDWDDHQAKGVYSQDGVLPKVNSNVDPLPNVSKEPNVDARMNTLEQYFRVL